jgi:putative DNA primase/helicase
VNIATEINTRLDPATFKAMCSGEAVQVKRLYSDIRDMTNYGKMVFLANELPRDVENTDGFFRRLLLVPFTVSIPKEEWDLGLAHHITHNELPGVFNWVLEGLRRLWINRKFTHAKAVEDAVGQYRERADTVLGFIRELALEPSDNDQRPLKEWYAQYVTHCKDGGHRNPLAIQNFADRLRNNGFTVRRGAGGGNVVFAKAGTSIGNDNTPF